MAVNNNLTKQNSKPSFASFVKSDVVLNSLVKTLGNETKKNTFVSSIISAVSTNPDLQKCDYNTIINSALLGSSLNLSPSPQLGHYYMVPFNDTKNDRVAATFQLGYKGYLQLAIRSGQYKAINVIAIKENELINYNPLTEDIVINIMEDEEDRENAKTTGYYAMFELVNGFRKTMYWSKKKMETHATKYSAGYRAKKGYTFWEKDFDGMAFKTMLRQLISKWGIMSIEMQNAFERDYTMEDDKGNVAYVDNDVEYEEVPVVSEIVDKPKETKQQEQPIRTDLEGNPSLL